MRYIFLFLMLLSIQPLWAQVNIESAKAITPKEDYKNIKSISLYSDANSSVFVIFVKLAVRKHKHDYHTEVITVLEGTGDFYLSGEKIEIEAGDHIVIPPGTSHAVITTSKKPLKVISVQSPEFTGQDRIFLKEEPKATKDKKEEEEDDIPEYGE